MVDDLSRGRIIAVNGPLATAEVAQGKEILQNEVAYVNCQGVRLKAEVIRIRGRQIDMQVFESTTGMVIGDEVDFSGELLSATLGPGILGMIYDGLQNPLTQLENEQGFFLKRGQYLQALDEERMWEFTPSITVGAMVKAGQYLGSVPEGIFRHNILRSTEVTGSMGSRRNRACRGVPGKRHHRRFEERRTGTERIGHPQAGVAGKNASPGL